MNDFGSNYTSLGDKNKIPLTKDLILTILEQARIILIPFFREVSLQIITNEKGNKYPKLTNLAERILEGVFNDGTIDLDSEEEALIIAKKFVNNINKKKKSCLIFYFCSDEIVLNQIDEQMDAYGIYENENMTMEDIYVEEGCRFQKKISELANNEEELTKYLVKELYHLQNIFSTEDIINWDAASILNANENFQEYAGKNQTLIPIILDEYDYWEEIMSNENDY